MMVTYFILLFSLVTNVFLFNEKAKGERLVKKGIEAQAILVDVKQTGLYRNHQLQVKLQMEVRPHIGSNFITEVRHLMDYSDFKQLNIGDAVFVKYNPSNPKQVKIIML